MFQHSYGKFKILIYTVQLFGLVIQKMERSLMQKKQINSSDQINIVVVLEELVKERFFSLDRIFFVCSWEVFLCTFL